MKAKIAFYKAKDNYIDKAIRIWANSPYSHYEKLVEFGLELVVDIWILSPNEAREELLKII